jgi:hypothetical protein
VALDRFSFQKNVVELIVQNKNHIQEKIMELEKELVAVCKEVRSLKGDSDEEKIINDKTLASCLKKEVSSLNKDGFNYIFLLLHLL